MHCNEDNLNDHVRLWAGEATVHTDNQNIYHVRILVNCFEVVTLLFDVFDKERRAGGNYLPIKTHSTYLTSARA